MERRLSRRVRRSVATAAALIAAVSLHAGAATAGTLVERSALDPIPVVGPDTDCRLFHPVPFHSPGSDVDAAPLPSGVLSVVQVIDNLGFTTQAGEPTSGGTIRRTAWRCYTAPKNGRVVLNTFRSRHISATGDEADTTLAVYRRVGGALTRIAFNDDRKIAGASSKTSLVQFDAVAGRSYLIQIGIKTDVNADYVLSGVVFPPGGGIVVQGADYLCQTRFGSCPPADAVVYNATGGRVALTAAANFAAGVTPPAPFTLAPGAGTLKSFAFGPGFDATTVRTVRGGFVFTGRVNGKVTYRASLPATVLVGSDSSAAVRVTGRGIATGAVGEPIDMPLVVTNVGTVPAKGCAVVPRFDRSDIATRSKRVNAFTGKPVGPVNPAFDVAPGQTVRVIAASLSVRTEVSPLDTAPGLEVRCANTDPFAITLGDFGRRFAMTATVRPLVEPVATAVTPTGQTVTVAADGSFLRATFRNEGAPGDVRARVAYTRGPSDAANTVFPAVICPSTMSNAACRLSTATEIPLSFGAGSVRGVKVFVRRPTVNPGVDPAVRGLTVTLVQSTPDLVDAPVGGFTRALRLP